jgi:uncharacterized protein (UPF0262 family)
MRHVLARVVAMMDIVPAENFDAKKFRNGLMNMRTTILETNLIAKVKRRNGISIDDLLH